MLERRRIILKTPEEIDKLYRANQLVGMTQGELAKHIQPGISTKQLDKIAYEFICDHGAKPAFLGYNGFPGTLCTSVNEYIVHGFPSDSTILKEGDIISVDCGTILDGFVGDSAFTFPVGDIEDEVKSLLRTTYESLYASIDIVQVGKRIGDIGNAVQTYCEKRGYSVVREFTGHGIGRAMHEAPNVPNYGRPGTGAKIEEGMCICIEPMINLGSKNVVIYDDGWTTRTKDRKPSAHFEHCIAVVDGKAKIMSSFDFLINELGNLPF